ncbi:MAG: hypothetical protein P5681_23015 [Limnospira sp. PMC 894.15]|nr:hypothetical protein [Limnospira sp. PMC 894.15]
MTILWSLTDDVNPHHPLKAIAPQKSPFSDSKKTHFSPLTNPLT